MAEAEVQFVSSIREIAHHSFQQHYVIKDSPEKTASLALSEECWEPRGRKNAAAKLCFCYEEVYESGKCSFWLIEVAVD